MLYVVDCSHVDISAHLIKAYCFGNSFAMRINAVQQNEFLPV